MSSQPPSPPKITEQDRSTFKLHVQQALRSKGISGRALEKKIGMARGTLSKLYSGRLTLTLRTLKEIATELAIGPELLVSKTNLAALLSGAPQTAESTELSDARGEIDGLRAERAAADATLQGLREENERLQQEIVTGRAAADSANTQLSTVKAELETHKASATAAVATQRQLERERDERTRALVRVQSQLTAETARSVENASALDTWREHALEREQRVQYLEAELNRARTTAAKASSAEAGKVLLAALASLGIGIAIGDSS